MIKKCFYAVAIFYATIINYSMAINPGKYDIVYGSQNAPLTVIEYSALTCPACALYDLNIFPKIYKKFIKTGKIRYIWRSVINNEAAKRATQLLYCKNGQYAHYKEQDMIENIKTTFLTMRSWSKYNNTNDQQVFSSLALMNGVTDYKKCFNNAKITKALDYLGDEISESGISGTPSFIINNNIYTISDFSSSQKIDAVANDTILFFSNLIKKSEAQLKKKQGK